VHELGLTQEIVEIACGEALKSGPGARVSRVVVEVGMLAAVLPEALAFCFELCAEGTAAEGAALEIARVPGRGRCRDCGAGVALEKPFGTCACGGHDLAWLSGDELKVKALEILPCA
jgi:hydrogenase nickel incorporation protein HypA/HybF